MLIAKRPKLQKLITVIGGCLILMPSGLVWFWGNMVDYALSYVVMNNGPTPGLESPWVMSLAFCSWITVLCFYTSISKVIGPRWILLLGIFVTDMAGVASYWAIQHSFMAFNLMMGIGTGVGLGLSHGTILQVVMAQADQDVGFLGSVVQGSFSIGAFFLTQIVTWYANPHNLSPDFRLGQMMFFTQKSVVDKAPSMFLVYVCYSFALQTIGYSLLQFNPTISIFGCCKDTEDNSKASEHNDSVKKNDFHTAFYKDGQDSYTDEGIILQEIMPGQENIREPEISQVSQDSTPKEMMSRPLFYFMWISFFIADISFTLMANFYKVYGLLWIRDDQFLTDVGTALVLVSSMSRPIWGLATDKYGVKNCFIVLVSSMVMVIAWFCFTAKVNRWLYCFTTLIYGCFGSAMYSCFMAVTVKIYGAKHVSTNYGLLMTSSVAFNLMALFVVEPILSECGWLLTFDIPSALSLISLLLCLATWPRV